jgi:ribulose-5-phosphate 4-epimerase/fuculose-1-phosphate aldolase
LKHKQIIMSEQELREQICLIGQLMHRQGYIDGASGNISARLDADGEGLYDPRPAYYRGHGRQQNWAFHTRQC